MHHSVVARKPPRSLELPSTRHLYKDCRKLRLVWGSILMRMLMRL
jgi:hypothetical protein